MRQGFRRVPVSPPAQQQYRPYTFVAPTRGWIESENLASAMPGGARLLENIFPTQTGARLRGGTRRKATIGNVPVESMFTYVSGNLKRLFAATSTAVFDITSVGSPTVPPAPVITGQTRGYYSSVPFTNSGGSFLYIVNGNDDPQLFNGTTWKKMNASSTPALTGTTVSTLSNVWKYRNRLFFIAAGTMSAWYLPDVNAIAGALVELPLSGVFKRGGSLLYGATWSLDAGNGVDEKCVFVSTEGEVVIFEGDNPANITTWRKAGQYDTPPSLGKNANTQVGGDLLLVTEGGIVPITAVFTKDSAALSLAAITRNIEPSWRKEVIDRRGLPWEIIKWPTYNMGIVSLPTAPGKDPYCFVVNLETGAWTKYTGWDTRCLVLFDNWAYFGTSDGKIMQCEIGGNDDGAVYECKYTGLFEHMGSIGISKTIHMARATFIASKKFNPRVSMSTDYAVNFPPAPNAVVDISESSNWDIGLWDKAKWDGKANVSTVQMRWSSIGRSGFAIAPQLQVTCGGTDTPDAELVTMDVTYEIGAMVV